MGCQRAAIPFHLSKIVSLMPGAAGVSAGRRGASAAKGRYHRAFIQIANQFNNKLNYATENCCEPTSK